MTLDRSQANFHLTLAAKRKHLETQWIPFLNDNERFMVYAIFDRSEAFGHESTKTTIKQFIQGTPPKQGFCGFSPWPITRQTIYNVRKNLIDFGIIDYKNDVYSFKWECSADTLFSVSKVKIRYLSKNKHNKNIENSVKLYLYNVSSYSFTSLYSNIYTNNSSNNSALYARVNSKGELERNILGVKKMREDLKKDRRKRNSISDRLKLFYSAWASAYKELYGVIHPPFSIAEQRNVKIKILKFCEDNNIDVEKFAIFCVSSWRGVHKQYFSWIKKPGRANITFVWRNILKFFEAYETEVENDLDSKKANDEYQNIAKQALARGKELVKENERLKRQLRVKRKTKINKTKAPIQWATDEDF